MRSSLAPQVSHVKKRKACMSDDAGISRFTRMVAPQNAQITSPRSSMRHQRGGGKQRSRRHVGAAWEHYVFRGLMAKWTDSAVCS